MIEWNDSLKTGHEPIDSDHCGLVSLLNSMERDLRERKAVSSIPGSILTLRDYVRQHFDREETHMIAVGCPAYARNRMEHARFAQRLEGWVARLESEGPSTALAFDVFHGTGNWFATHIPSTDCELRDCKRLRSSQPVTPAP
jgi:hemerythrin